MLNVALFGPPGAGKGTQSEFLLSKYHLHYISTGDMLRQEIARGTRLGLEAQDIIASGGLVSDEIIVQILEATITQHPDANGFLFDGFPRTAIQAYILEGLMIKLHTSLTCLISLVVPEQVTIDRLLRRGQSSGRTDDNETVIRNRLREYEAKTRPVLNFYHERGLVREVDGTPPVEEVARAIDEFVRQELNAKRLHIVLFGYPGSGRGSQGKALARRFGLEYVATGEMLDAEIRSGSETGKKINELYENGQLVPDEIVVPLMEKKLAASKDVKGYIFKGFPRTLVQSYILDGLLKKHGASSTKVIELSVPTLELIRRLDARSQTDRCMPYDRSTSRIVQRLHEHETKTMPVIDRYRQYHGVTTINGEGSFDEVFARLAFEVENGLQSLR